MNDLYDFCVIGAGITGLTISILLCKKGYKVILLEKNTIEKNSSSNNAGQLLIGFKDYDALKKEGANNNYLANPYRQATHEGIELIKKFISVYKINCGFTKNQYHINNAIDDDFYFEEEAYCFDPKCYVQELKKIFLDHGGSLNENTTVLQIKVCDPVLLITSEGNFYSKRIILSSNGADNLNIFPKNKLEIIKTCLLKSNLIKKDHLHFCENYSVARPNCMIHYYRYLPEGRLIFGIHPGVGMRFSRFTLINELKDIFPEIHELHIEEVISGNISVTKSGLPIIGHINEKIFYSGGCLGRGLVTGTMAAKLIFDKLFEKPNLFNLFASINHESF